MRSRPKAGFGVHRVTVSLPEIHAAEGALLIRQPGCPYAYVLQRIWADHPKINVLAARGALVPVNEPPPPVEQWDAVAQQVTRRADMRVVRGGAR